MVSLEIVPCSQSRAFPIVEYFKSVSASKYCTKLCIPSALRGTVEMKRCRSGAGSTFSVKGTADLNGEGERI